MKYYSETLDRLFDTPDSLQRAELKYQEEIEAQEEAKKAEAASKATRKKELAKAVEDADAAVDTAYETLEIAKRECKKIADEANKAISEILTEAQQGLSEAQKSRLNAMTAFTNEFGPFKTTYTGARAEREINRAQRMIDDLFKTFTAIW